MDIMIGILWLLSLIAVVSAGEYCWMDNNRYEYCSYGCCGDFPDEHCCSVYVWAIILAVIGTILFISFIIAVICCWYKKKGHTGRVMTSGTPGQATVTTVNYVQPNPQYGFVQPPGYQPGFQQGYQPPPGYQPSPGYQPLPPSYGQSSSYPPAGGFQQSSDPAFPPPPPKY